MVPEPHLSVWKERDQLRAEVERLKDALEAELAKLRAGAGQVAYITGQFAGRCVIEAINRASVLPTGMALYSAPQPSAVPDVSRMARVLSDRAASACCVDPEDNWKVYGHEFIDDVRAILAAAPAPVPNSRELIVSKLQTECSAVVDDTNHLVAKLSAKYPPAVNLTMHDILRALEAVPGAPMLTSNMCHAIAQQLNAAQLVGQLPVGYVHFKAPVQAEPANPWVSVSERLPEPETDVVVRFVFGGAVYHGVAGLFGDAGEFEWWEQSSQAELRGRVTHWMPLQPAPESSK